jgi:hypothetical protein
MGPLPATLSLPLPYAPPPRDSALAGSDTPSKRIGGVSLGSGDVDSAARRGDDFAAQKRSEGTINVRFGARPSPRALAPPFHPARLTPVATARRRYRTAGPAACEGLGDSPYVFSSTTGPLAHFFATISDLIEAGVNEGTQTKGVLAWAHWRLFLCPSGYGTVAHGTRRARGSKRCRLRARV